ncbi:MAG TPA: VWA domain-containing protein [Vicinamibacteria bacterium]|nr:VWA domain-containing protein [Vicinamibacteria bacterium]
MIRAGVLATVMMTPSAGPQAFRVDVTAVQVDVFVGHGKNAVLGLAADDFEVHDNGVLQVVDRVEAKTVPVNALLALDVSHSVSGQKLEYLKRAATTMLNGLETGDGAALITFSSVIQVTRALDGSFARLNDEIDRTAGFGSTSLNDGLFATFKIAEEVERPFIVVFTDGEDRFSWLSKDQVYDAAKRSEATVFVVATKQTPPRFALTTDFFEELAQMSGGIFFEVDSSRLPEIFASILAQLKTRYVLSYHPRGDLEPGWHELEVRLRGRRATVRARRGYYRGAR